MSKTIDWSKYAEVKDEPKKEIDWSKYDEVKDTPEDSSILSTLGEAASTTADTLQAIPSVFAKGATIGALPIVGGGITGGYEYLRSKLAEAVPSFETNEEEVNRQLREQGFKGDLPVAGEKSYEDLYKESKAGIKDYEKQQEANLPYTALPLEIAGGIATLPLAGVKGAISAAKLAPEGASALKGILSSGVQAAGEGAAYGGVSGFAEGKGDLFTEGGLEQTGQEMLESGALGAAIGGAIGGGGKAATEGISAGVNQAKEFLAPIRNQMPAIDKLASIYERSAEGTLKTGQNELLEQGTQQLKNIRELANTGKKVLDKQWAKVENLRGKISEGADVTDQLLSIKSDINSGKYEALSDAAQKEVETLSKKIDDLIYEQKVVKTVEQQAVEKSDLTRKKLLDDYRAKKQLKDAQDLAGQEIEKAASKADLKRERLLEDAKRKAEMTNEEAALQLGDIEQLSETQRQAFSDLKTGKTYSTPIKEPKATEVPEFSDIESQPDLNRAVFRNKQTGETIETPFTGQDITEPVLSRKVTTPEELLAKKKQFGALSRGDTATPVAGKLARDVSKVYDDAIQGKLIETDAKEFKGLNKAYGEIVQAFDLLNPKIRSLDPVDRENAARAVADMANRLGDSRNIPDRVVMNEFFETVGKYYPEEIKPIKEKVMSLAKDIELNKTILGVDPTSSGMFSRLLGAALTQSAKFAQAAGQRAYKAKNKLPLNNTYNRIKMSTGQELQQKASLLRNQGEESAANFFENLANVSDNRKKALLFTAAQNPNLKKHIMLEDEEND